MQQSFAFARKMVLAFAIVAAGLWGMSSDGMAQPMQDGWEATWLKAGNKALKKDDYEAARQDFEKAAILNPKSAEAYVGLGRTHRELGNKSAAYKHFRTALEIEPDNLAALSEGGLAALALDKKSRAEQFRDRLSSLCGVSCNAYRTLDKAVRDYRPPEKPVIAEAPQSEEELQVEEEAAPESEDEAVQPEASKPEPVAPEAEEPAEEEPEVKE